MATAFACPHCAGTVTDVLDSRPATVLGHPSVRRRRRCKGCGDRFSTVEVFSDDLEAAADLQALRLKMLAATNRFLEAMTSGNGHGPANHTGTGTFCGEPGPRISVDESGC